MTAEENSAVEVVCGVKAAAALLEISPCAFAHYCRTFLHPALIEKRGRINIFNKARLLELWKGRERGNIRTGHIYHRKSYRAWRKGHKGCYYRNEWYGVIRVHGKIFRHYANSRESAEVWCRDMINKYGKYYDSGRVKRN